jgi:hypothetical protein
MMVSSVLGTRELHRSGTCGEIILGSPNLYSKLECILCGLVLDSGYVTVLRSSLSPQDFGSSFPSLGPIIQLWQV